jgi:prepilin-type N-terminal cleavage/methylation domain-containing protein
MDTKRYISKLGRRIHYPAGFTLAEMMMGTAIGVIVMAAVLTTYVLCLKQFRAISNYMEIHRAGRQSVDVFSQDIRGVSRVSSLNKTSLVVVIPTAFNSSGSVISNKTVTYSCNVSNGTLKRTDSSTGLTRVLASNINDLTFSLYDHVGSNTAVLTSAKGIQLDIKLRKTVMSQIQSEDFLSARLDMRNVP